MVLLNGQYMIVSILKSITTTIIAFVLQSETLISILQFDIFISLNNYLSHAYHLLDNVLIVCNIRVKKTEMFLME